MAMGKKGEQQDELFVPYSQMRSAGHPFYRALDGVLREHGFDRYAERLCGRYYHPVMGRPGLAPGNYFRSLLVGYFEGIDSERGIAWRRTIRRSRERAASSTRRRTRRSSRGCSGS